MSTMIQDKGPEYIARWTRTMAEKFNTTEDGILRFARKQGVDTIGDLTPAQAKAVISELTFYSLPDRQAEADSIARANAMVPPCDNCGDCPQCC